MKAAGVTSQAFPLGRALTFEGYSKGEREELERELGTR